MPPEVKEPKPAMRTRTTKATSCSCADKPKADAKAAESEAAALVAGLRGCVDGWDGKDNETVESLIISSLSDYPGNLNLGPMVTNLMAKIKSTNLGDRILGHLHPHTFDLKDGASSDYNMWWGTGTGTISSGPVGTAAMRMELSWVTKLLHYLRTHDRLTVLKNEVAVAASALTVDRGVTVSEKVIRLLQILPMLLDAGCDVNAKAGGFTALHYIASAVSRSERGYQNSREDSGKDIDSQLAALCLLLRQRGARFDIAGDYAPSPYKSSSVYRGWTPTSNSYDPYHHKTAQASTIHPPRPSATAIDIFMAREWKVCVKALLSTKPQCEGCGISR